MIIMKLVQSFRKELRKTTFDDLTTLKKLEKEMRCLFDWIEKKSGDAYAAEYAERIRYMNSQ